MKTRIFFSSRAFTSLLLSFSFLGLAVSGIILYAAPQCSVAEAMSWTAAGLSKGQWSSIHMTTALIFLALTAIHLFVYNWKCYTNYMKNRRAQKVESSRKVRPELIGSLILSLLILGGAAWMIFPFSLLPEAHESIENYYREQSGFDGRGHGRQDAYEGGLGRQYERFERASDSEVGRAWQQPEYHPGQNAPADTLRHGTEDLNTREAGLGRGDL